MPLENKFNYCPNCGEKSPEWDGEKRWHCTHCDFVLYHNCAAAVALIVRHEDKILFTTRNQNPSKGLLDLPGGFVDPYESAEQACVRELYEELNIIINPKALRLLQTGPNLYPYKGIEYHTLDLFMEYIIEEPLETTQDPKEIAAVKWIKLDAIEYDQLAFESQKIFLHSYANL